MGLVRGRGEAEGVDSVRGRGIRRGDDGPAKAFGRGLVIARWGNRCRLNGDKRVLLALDIVLEYECRRQAVGKAKVKVRNDQCWARWGCSDASE